MMKGRWCGLVGTNCVLQRLVGIWVSNNSNLSIGHFSPNKGGDCKLPITLFCTEFSKKSISRIVILCKLLRGITLHMHGVAFWRLNL